ncbi:MAG: GNAT family N-acetyltransferase [Opitutaceae bacterium]|nr:GNAT family N-acetyltransferase [Opitutaceae bacterium]
MHHTISAEGFGIRLRPVRMEDAPFIVWLRNLNHVKGRVGDSATTVESQRAWLAAYFDRPNDLYFLIETIKGTPLGAYGIYDIADGSGESGRWAVRPLVPAAIPAVILGFDLGFGALGLKELRIRTVSTNQPVLSMNRKIGLRQIQVVPGETVIGGESVDIVHFRINASEWEQSRRRLSPLATLAEKQMAECESQLATNTGDDAMPPESKPPHPSLT